MAKSLLLTLPEELQTRIYELVLVQSDPIRPAISRIADIHKRKNGCSLALLATCHSIRRIAKEAYYGQNTFVIGEGEGDDVLAEPSNMFDAVNPSTLRLCRKVFVEVTFTDTEKHYEDCSELENVLAGEVCFWDWIEVDFKAKKIEADLRVPCCGREQTQYASLVAYLKGKLAALEWGYERAHLA